MSFQRLREKHPYWNLQSFKHPGREGSAAGEVGEFPHWQIYGWKCSLDGNIISNGRSYICVKTDPDKGEEFCADEADKLITQKEKELEAEL